MFNTFYEHAYIFTFWNFINIVMTLNYHDYFRGILIDSKNEIEYREIWIVHYTKCH